MQEEKRGHSPVRNQVMTIHLGFECISCPDCLLRRNATQEQAPHHLPWIFLGSVEDGDPVFRNKQIYSIYLEGIQMFILKIEGITVSTGKLYIWPETDKFENEELH